MRVRSLNDDITHLKVFILPLSIFFDPRESHSTRVDRWETSIPIDEDSFTPKDSDIQHTASKKFASWHDRVRRGSSHKPYSLHLTWTEQAMRRTGTRRRWNSKLRHKWMVWIVIMQYFVQWRCHWVKFKSCFPKLCRIRFCGSVSRPMVGRSFALD